MALMEPQTTNFFLPTAAESTQLPPTLSKLKLQDEGPTLSPPPPPSPTSNTNRIPSLSSSSTLPLSPSSDKHPQKLDNTETPHKTKEDEDEEDEDDDDDDDDETSSSSDSESEPAPPPLPSFKPLATSTPTTSTENNLRVSNIQIKESIQRPSSLDSMPTPLVSSTPHLSSEPLIIQVGRKWNRPVEELPVKSDFPRMLFKISITEGDQELWNRGDLSYTPAETNRSTLVDTNRAPVDTNRPTADTSRPTAETNRSSPTTIVSANDYSKDRSVKEFLEILAEKLGEYDVVERIKSEYVDFWFGRG